MHADSLLKSKTVQFDQFPVIPIRMISSKIVITPDISPMAPNHHTPNNANFSSTLRKNCKEFDTELKKSESALKRQSMGYLCALAMLPRFHKQENQQLQGKRDIFKAAFNLLDKPQAPVTLDQMIYRTDDPKFI